MYATVRVAPTADIGSAPASGRSQPLVGTLAPSAKAGTVTLHQTEIEEDAQLAVPPYTTGRTRVEVRAVAISMSGLPAFLLYFIVGSALIAVFAALYLRFTAHDEIALIRAGNLSAAIAFGGNLAGFAIPLEKAISQASSVADCMLWSLAAMLIQFAVYGLSRVLIPGLSEKIEQDRLPSAVLLAVMAMIGGTLAAASMTA